MLEQPIYVLQQMKRRAVLPKLLSLIILGVVFYLGILLNISLLALSAREETIVKTASLALLLLIIMLGAYLSYRRSGKPYLFYQNKVIAHGKTIHYTAIVNTAPRRDLWDRLFKTYSINLDGGTYLRHLPQAVDIHSYLQQLIAYAQKR